LQGVHFLQCLLISFHVLTKEPVSHMLTCSPPDPIFSLTFFPLSATCGTPALFFCVSLDKKLSLRFIYFFLDGSPVSVNKIIFLIPPFFFPGVMAPVFLFERPKPFRVSFFLRMPNTPQRFSLLLPGTEALWLLHLYDVTLDPL